MNINDNNSATETSNMMWLAIVVLAIATFTIVTTELAPIGLLTPMALDLKQSESMIGLTVTIYAWIGAVSALLSSIFLGNLPKKTLLIILMLVLFIANILCAVSTDYSLLLVARVVGAFAHGAFWAMIGALAMSIVSVRHIGLATSIVFGGVSAASVFGVPIANFIGSHATWQMAFWLISALSLFSLVGILILVPNVKINTQVGIAALKNIVSNRTLLKIYAATFLAITAHFSAFTFIEPYLNASEYIQTDIISVVLLLFGIAGLIGNFITGVFIDKHLKPLILLSITITAVSLFLLGSFTDVLGRLTAIGLIMLWGVSISGIFVGFQTWVLRTAQDNAFSASAVYVSIFNAAIGSGALFGAWVVANFSFTTLMTYSAIAIALSLVITGIVPGRIESSSSPQLGESA